MALRLAEVQPPNTAATLSCEISLWAFSANVGQSEAPSWTTGCSCFPSTPPLAFISEIASSSASFTETSLIAIVPLNECSTPTLIFWPEDVVDAEPPPLPVAQAVVASAAALSATATWLSHELIGLTILPRTIGVAPPDGAPGPGSEIRNLAIRTRRRLRPDQPNFPRRR